MNCSYSYMWFIKVGTIGSRVTFFEKHTQRWIHTILVLVKYFAGTIIIEIYECFYLFLIVGRSSWVPFPIFPQTVAPNAERPRCISRQCPFFNKLAVTRKTWQVKKRHSSNSMLKIFDVNVLYDTFNGIMFTSLT